MSLSSVNFTANTSSTSDIHFKYVSSVEWILINGYYVICGSGGTIGNGLLLTLFLKYRNLRKEDCVYLITILACGDLVASAGYIITGGVNLYRHFAEVYNIPSWQCLLSPTGVVMGLYMDQLFMLSIAIDRLQAFRQPFNYYSKDHRRYALITTILVVGFSVASVFPGLFTGVDLWSVPLVCTIGGSCSRGYIIFYVLFNLLIVPSVLIVYLWVAIELYKKMNRISPDSVSTKKPSGIGKCRRNFAGNGSTKSGNDDIRMSVTRTLVIIVGVYAIASGLPNVCFVIAAGRGMSSIVKGRLTLYIGLGSCTSTAVNVLIYGKSHHLYKQYMTHFFTNHSATDGNKLIHVQSMQMRCVQKNQERLPPIVQQLPETDKKDNN